MTEQERLDLEAGTIADRRWNEMKQESLDPLPSLKEQLIDYANDRQMLHM